jgi:hypothetical protein
MALLVAVAPGAEALRTALRQRASAIATDVAQGVLLPPGPTPLSSFLALEWYAWETHTIARPPSPSARRTVAGMGHGWKKKSLSHCRLHAGHSATA